MKQLRLIFLCVLLSSSANVFAWGKEGHEMVAQMAYNLLSEKAKERVKQYLGSISIPQAGTWMDDVRSDKGYDFMKSWHYINIDKGSAYTPTTDENAVNEIIRASRELEHMDKLCLEQIKFDILVLFHLIGDIHQPLHAGYGADKGGNDIQVLFNSKKTNLHKLWDTELIQDQRITLTTLEKAYTELTPADIEHSKGTTVEDWVKVSRMYLPVVYNFTDGRIDESYAKQNKELIISQLMNAAIHLAAALEKALGEAPVAEITTRDPSATLVEITPDMAANYIGKEVRVCGKVYGVSELANINFINMGAAYPNAPFTVVIFSADKANMKTKLSKYDRKEICVTGVIEEYKGKPQIKVKAETQIELK